MRKFLKKFWLAYRKVITFTIFLFGLLIIIFHFYTLSQSFYFTGDITSYFEPAFPGRRGDLLSVFIWSYAVWPPLVSFILNILRFLPVSIISQHHLYIFMTALLSAAVVYLISWKMIPQMSLPKGGYSLAGAIKWQIPIIALVLFTNFQALLFITAMSEPLFILLWLAAIYCLERFITTQKERFLIFYVITGSLIPMSRYSGIPVLLSLEIILLLFAILTFKRRAYSPSLILTAGILVWVPILMYLLRNYILSHTFFGTFDKLTDPMMKNYNYALMSFLPKIGHELLLPLIAGLIIGVQLKWQKTVKNILILSVISTAAYYLGLASSMTRIRFTEYFPSRYTSVAYPELLLATICMGSFIMHFKKIARFRLLATVSLLLAAIILGRELTLSFQRYNAEKRSPKSVIFGAEYSDDIRNFCPDNDRKYLFLRESSRNWIGQALSYYCQPITIIPLNTTDFKLPQDALLYTPYKLQTSGLELIKTYQGDKKINLYTSSQQTVLPVEKFLLELKQQQTQE